eukprot:g1768.t1
MMFAVVLVVLTLLDATQGSGSDPMALKELLMRAMNNGDANGVARILNDHPDMANLRDAYSVSLLHVAAGTGDSAMVDAVLKSGADVNIALDSRGGHREGETPLHFAVVENANYALRRLLEAEGVDVNAENAGGLTPLHIAAGVGHVAPMRVLLDSGADVLRKASNKYESLPIHLAAASSLAQAADLLLLHGSPFDVPNALGVYPIHAAALAGSPETVRVLLEAGADPSVLNRDGKTAFEVAEALALGGDADVAAALDELRSMLISDAKLGDDPHARSEL